MSGADRVAMLLFALVPAMLGTVLLVAALLRPDGGLDALAGRDASRCLALALLVLVPSALLIYGSAVFHNRQLSRTQRVSWALALLAFGPVAAPLYWWKHLRQPAAEPIAPRPPAPEPVRARPRRPSARRIPAAAAARSPSPAATSSHADGTLFQAGPQPPRPVLMARRFLRDADGERRRKTTNGTNGTNGHHHVPFMRGSRD